MDMSVDDAGHQLKRLLIGLVDQEIIKGKEFVYDSGKLYADEVADLMLPSVLCLASDVAVRLGLGSLGYQFSLAQSAADGLPLVMQRADGAVAFSKVAPFVVEIFDGEMMDCRLDLARLFETAARLVNPEFVLRAAGDDNDLEL